MRRFFREIYAIVVAVLFVAVGCVEQPRAESGDFRVLKGATNNRIVLDATKGSWADIDIAAKHDWEILDTKGFVCTPSSGSPTECTTVRVEALRNNNSVDTVKLGDLHFRLLSTRFVGLTVHQLPRMTVDREKVVLSGVAGAKNRVYVETDAEFEISYSKGARFTAEVDADDEGAVVVTALEDNNGSSVVSLGEITIALADAPSCSTTVEVVQQVNKHTPLTLMFYFLGTSLSTYYNQNVDAIVEALSNNIQGEARVLVLKQSSTTDASIYELRYDAEQKCCVNEKVKNLSFTTPYDAALFKRVISEFVAIAPANSYALVVGSHGTGWIPKVPDAATQRLLRNMGLSDGALGWRREGALQTRHIGDKAPTQYDIADIVKGISENNIELEYLLFDACFMSSIEAAYDMRNTTKSIIASPCEVMGAGFPYAKILPSLLQNSGTEYDIDGACKAYVEHYKTATTPSACVAHIVTSGLAELATKMRAVNGAERSADFDIASVQAYEGLSEHIFYDLEQYVEESCADAAAVEAFKAQLAKCVLSRYHTDSFYSVYGPSSMIPIEYYGGITTSADVAEYAEDWKNTTWYKDTH